MIDVQDFIEHISKECGTNSESKYAFQSGYLIGILEGLQLRCPEVRESLESHARQHNYVGKV